MKYPISSIIFITLILSVPAFGKKAKRNTKKKIVRSRVSRKLASDQTLIPEEKTVINYFSCFQKTQKQEKLKACIDTLIYKHLSSSDKDRFYSWLVVFEASLVDFHECSERKEVEVSFFPQATDYYLCGTLRVSGSKKEAVFFFKKEASKQSKLYSVYY